MKRLLTNKKRKKNVLTRIYVTIASLLLLVIVILLFWKTSIGTSIVQATAVKPETFTELYFSNHTNLPSKIDTGKIYSFAFTVHNVEAKQMDYKYIVFMQSKNSKELIDTKSIELQNNQTTTISESFELASPVTQAEIVVRLINKDQQIDFYVNK